MELTLEAIGKIEQAAVRAAEVAVQRKVPYPRGSPSARVFLQAFAAAVYAQVIGSGEFARGGLVGNDKDDGGGEGLRLSLADADDAALIEAVKARMEADPELLEALRELVSDPSEDGAGAADEDQVVSDELTVGTTGALPEAEVTVVSEDGFRELVEGTVEQTTPEADAAAGAADETAPETPPDRVLSDGQAQVTEAQGDAP